MKNNLKKTLKKYYTKYAVYTEKLNEFKESTGEMEFIKNIHGLFYSKRGNVSKKVDKTGMTMQEKRYYIHTLDVSGINTGMIINIDEKQYAIIDIENEAEINSSYIITLEKCHDKN